MNEISTFSFVSCSKLFLLYSKINPLQSKNQKGTKASGVCNGSFNYLCKEHNVWNIKWPQNNKEIKSLSMQEKNNLSSLLYEVALDTLFSKFMQHF